MVDLKPTLSLWRGTGMMVSIVLGAGLLTLPGLAVDMVGDAAVLVWLLCALAAIPMLAVFAVLAARRPSSGGLAAILADGFGDVGFAAGTYLLLGAVVLGLPAIALTGGHYLAAATGASPHLWALGLLSVAILVNLRSAEMAARINALLAGAVLLAVLAVLVVGISVTQPSLPNLSVNFATMPSMATLAACFIMVFFAFTGWEVAANLAGEFRSPKRDIPLAIGLSFIIVVAIYFGLALIADAAAPLKQPEALFAELLGGTAGPAGAAVVAAVAACLILANLSAAIWSVSRMVFAAAEAGLLPTRFTRTRRGIPNEAVLVTGGTLCAVTFLSWSGAITLAGLLVLAGQNFLLLYAGAAAVMLRLATRPAARIAGAVSLLIVAVVVLMHGATSTLYPAALIAAATASTWAARFRAPACGAGS